MGMVLLVMMMSLKSRSGCEPRACELLLADKYAAMRYIDPIYFLMFIDTPCILMILP